MERLNKYIIGAVIGIIVGLWFGVNIGKGKDFWANPFEDKPLSEIAKDTTKELTEKAKDKTSEMVKEGKKALRDKLEEDAEKK